MGPQCAASEQPRPHRPCQVNAQSTHLGAKLHRHFHRHRHHTATHHEHGHFPSGVVPIEGAMSDGDSASDSEERQPPPPPPKGAVEMSTSGAAEEAKKWDGGMPKKGRV